MKLTKKPVRERSWFEIELRAKGPTLLLFGSFVLTFLGVIVLAIAAAGGFH